MKKPIQLTFLFLSFLIFGCSNTDNLDKSTQELLAQHSEWTPEEQKRIIEAPGYVIKSGDTFSKVSRLYDITVKDLIDTNSEVSPMRLKIGQVLKIKNVE
jgi:LysM repeat protein